MVTTADGPLRITHVLTNAEFAGTERYVLEVSRTLAERGHDVEVIGGRPDTMRELVADTVTWRPGADLAATLRSLRAGGRRDIVHSHMTKADFAALLTSPVTRGRRVATRHITARRGFSPIAFRAGLVVRRALARELAVSGWTSDQLDRPADQVLLNGVEAQPDVDGARTNTVLVAQRLAPEKDTATAIRAWHTSGLGRRGWRLTIAGSGEQEAELRALVGELGELDTVDFVGWLADVAAAYRTSAMLLAPAPTEPCGLVILEAMAYGLPVLAAAAGGTLETVGTCPGAAMFPAGNHEAAAAHLVRLADDPAARESYGVALRELQRASFSIDGHVDALERVYRDVVTA